MAEKKKSEPQRGVITGVLPRRVAPNYLRTLPGVPQSLHPWLNYNRTVGGQERRIEITSDVNKIIVCHQLVR